MDMNKCFFLRKEDRQPRWRLIDASGKVLGRLATEVADILRGKDKVDYTPHVDAGDYVVIINCKDVVLTGNKREDKIYARYSGWRSGRKERTAKEVFEKDPTFIIKQAVKNMLPKNRLSRQVIKKLKIYVDASHPHEAQVNTFKPE